MIDIQVTNCYQLLSQIQAWEIVPPLPVSTTVVIANDPGVVHFGYAVLSPNGCYIFQGTEKRDKDPVTRMLFTRSHVESVLYELEVNYQVQVVNGLGVIENAAYGANFRQTELAEARAVVAMSWIDWGIFDIKMPSPLTIRKVVFGSGKIKAHEYWNIEGHKCPDALAALSCAYYGVISKP